MNISSKLRMQMKNPLITGTLLLTLAGVASRIIGFFYRIFLSRRIGAESLGLYQLTFPVLAMCLSLTSSGIQTALSRFVAQGRSAMRFFYTAVVLSCGLSLAAGLALHLNSDRIAEEFLGDIRCSGILSVMALSLIPAAVHACVNGYYYGKKKAGVPSASQLVEQLVRVGGVYLIYELKLQRGAGLTAADAMWGIVIGELSGFLYSTAALYLERKKNANRSFPSSPLHKVSRRDALCREEEPAMGANPPSGARVPYLRCFFLLCGMAVPLTFNHVLINLCTSVENMLIPRQLCLYGMSSGEALSVYGVLTGMALSVLLFPNVVSGSLSVLLLPAVSEAREQGREHAIRRAVKKALLAGMLLGGCFTAAFFLYGEKLGSLVFESPLAGTYIRQLCWICPFLFLSGMLGSILHGLGRPKTVLFINLLSCLIRIAFILLLVPVYGMNAYLWSLLLAQLFSSAASLIPLREYL